MKNTSFSSSTFFFRPAILASLLALVWLGCGCAGVPPTAKIVERITQPPPGKALVNFHRPSSYGKPIGVPIFDLDGKMLADMRGASLSQVVCDPGEKVFISWAEHVTVIKAELAPDKIYDVMVDVAPGWVQANIYLTPLAKNDARRTKLAEFDRREKWTIVANPNSPRVAQYETQSRDRIQQIKTDFLGGEKADRVKVIALDDCR
jgi:hypothetical protein